MCILFVWVTEITWINRWWFIFSIINLHDLFHYLSDIADILFKPIPQNKIVHVAQKWQNYNIYITQNFPQDTPALASLGQPFDMQSFYIVRIILNLFPFTLFPTL